MQNFPAIRYQLFIYFCSHPVTQWVKCEIRFIYVFLSHSHYFSRLFFQSLRSKTRTMDSFPSSIDALPVWNFDGSSTGQAVGHNSDIYMKPVSIYRYVCVLSKEALDDH